MPPTDLPTAAGLSFVLDAIDSLIAETVIADVERIVWLRELRAAVAATPLDAPK